MSASSTNAPGSYPPAQTPSARAPAVSIIGLGTLGRITGACLARAGHTVTGVDTDAAKRALFDDPQARNNKYGANNEAGLDELLTTAHEAGLVHVGDSIAHALARSDISFVCIDMAGTADDGAGLEAMRAVSQEIGTALRDKSTYHVVVFRSAVPPGTIRHHLLPCIEQASGQRCGARFGLCFHPEFLRRGCAVDDFFDPAHVIIGHFDRSSARPLEQIYDGLGQPYVYTSIEAAEMIKYTDDARSVLEHGFAAEIERLGQIIGADCGLVTQFLAERPLPPRGPAPRTAYPVTGFDAFAAKLRNVRYTNEALKPHTPILRAIAGSTQARVAESVDRIEASGAQTIGFLGIAVRPDGENIYASPVLGVMAALFARGYKIRLYDRNYRMRARLQDQLMVSQGKSAEMDALIDALPQCLCNTPQALRDSCEAIVVTHNDPVLREIARSRRPDQVVIDLARTFDGLQALPPAQRTGMDGFVAKPSNAQALSGVLDTWVAGITEPRVLLAEDDKAIAQITQLILQNFGCHVDVVSNGNAAVAAVQTHDFDLVLMDIVMPEKGGLEAAEEIRALPDKKAMVPILAFSAHVIPDAVPTWRAGTAI